MSPASDFEDVKKRLEKIASQYPVLALQAGLPAMESAMDLLYTKIADQDYPTKPDGSSYSRTDVLRNSWTQKSSIQDNAVIGEIGNIEAYAPWVVGADYPGEEYQGVVKYQARVHQKRWWQFDDIMQENIDGAWLRFEQKFTPEFERLIKEM